MTAAELQILEEANAAEQRVLLEALAPMPAPVSVAEIEQIVLEMEDDPQAFAHRFALMQRQMKRLSDFYQGLAGVPDQLARLEQTIDRINYWGKP